jgi:hypothetical protein
VTDAAHESMAAALAVAQSLHTDIAATVVWAAQTAFVDGLSAGSLVAAGVAALGAVTAAIFLPARQSRTLQEPVDTGSPDENPAATASRSSSAVSA